MAIVRTDFAVRELSSSLESVSMVLPFETEQFEIVKRGIYTAVLAKEGAPRGEAGDPALPWRKFFVYIPDGAKVRGARFEVRRTAPLCTDALIEPVQPDVPIFETERVRSVHPNPGIYERADVWPPVPGRFIVVRHLGGKQLAEIEVCPLQYRPAQRRVDVVAELHVEIDFSQPPAALRAELTPAARRFERRTVARVKQYVLNPDHVGLRPDVEQLPFDLRLFPDVPYVIVTSRALAPGFQRLADWRTLLGLNARVVAVEDIQANAVPETGTARFWLGSGYVDGGTRDLAEAIRNFVKWAQVNWQTEYVLMGGDTAVIPCRRGWMTNVGGMYYGNLSAPDTGRNLAGTASASSSAAGSTPAHAVDADAGTSWSCAANDASPWISVTLAGATAGRPVPLNQVQLVWGATAATAYKIQLSQDNVTWTDVHDTTSGAGGSENISLACTSAVAVRLLVRSGASFGLASLKVFGPAAGNTAYALTPTRTRVHLKGWIRPNPTNSADGDQVLIIGGAKAGTVVPYATAASETALGWHFVTDLTTVPGTVSAAYTPYLEICGPAASHGAAFCYKTEENYIPTDLYYADLDSPNAALHDWDADGNLVYGERYQSQIDGVNGLSDVHVGRFPVTRADHVALLVNKVIQYERYRDASSPFESLLPPDFATAALLAAQNWYDPGPGQLDGSASCNEEIRRVLLNSGRGWTFTRLYEDKDDIAAADVTPDLQAASKAAIKDAIAVGNNLVSLVSHGSSGSMCYLGTADVDDEANAPSVWYVNACSTNKFDASTISESAVLNTNGGALAYAGNSRYGWTSDGPMERVFWEEMLQSGRLGPMLERAHLIGGDWQKYSLNLLGDPAMRVWSAAPRHVSVTHPCEVYTGVAAALTVSVKCDGAPVRGAVVCITVGGAFHANAVTDAAGEARPTVNPSAPGTLHLAVSGCNVVPYIASVRVKVGTPAIAVSPLGLDFGRVAVGRSLTRALTIRSSGTAALTVSIAAPPHDSAFHWKAVNAAQLAPGQSLRHEVALAPARVGAMQGSLTVHSNAAGNPVTVALSGTAVSSQNEGDERYERCWVNGRPGYRRVIWRNGEWVSGPCQPGEIP